MRMSTHPHSCKLGIQLTPSIDLRNIFFRKWLNNFAKIGDRSRLRFLRTTTWILSRPVAFVESRLFINLETSLSQKHIAKFVFHWWGGESGRGWPLSSSAELEAKFITKIFALSVENLIWNFPELVESVSFQLCLCIAMVSILQNSCALIADSSESSKWFCYTAPSDCSNGNRELVWKWDRAGYLAIVSMPEKGGCLRSSIFWRMLWEEPWYCIIWSYHN